MWFWRRKHPKPFKAAPDAVQHQIGGTWGNHMRWWKCDFDKPEFKLWGHKPPASFPKVGDLVKAEMQKSWLWLSITNVRRMSDPTDMFFADAYPVYQEKKAQ